jgi:DNA polymerase III subunit beta
MEFAVSKSDFLRELSAVQVAIERKTTVPILCNVLLKVEGGALQIAATDLSISLRTSCPAAVKKEGSATLPAKKLYEYVKLLPEGEMFFALGENHWMNIKAGRNRTKMVGMATTNFPHLSPFPATAIDFPIPTLKAFIEKTIFSVSDEESRYTLQGSQLELGLNGAAMVATDGHRMSYLKIDKPIPGITDTIKLLIPKRVLVSLMALLGPYEDGMVAFAHDENTLYFKVASKILTGRKLTGTFPNYAAVLPKDHTVSVVIDSVAFRNSLQRVAQFTDDQSRVKLHFEKNSLILSAQNSEQGETEESLDIEFNGEPLSTAFNSNYIRDILRSLPESDRVRMTLKDKNSAAEFQPVIGMELATNRQIVMPLRCA